MKWLLIYMLYSPLSVLTVYFSLVFSLAKREKLLEKRKKLLDFQKKTKKILSAWLKKSDSFLFIIVFFNSVFDY